MQCICHHVWSFSFFSARKKNKQNYAVDRGQVAGHEQVAYHRPVDDDARRQQYIVNELQGEHHGDNADDEVAPEIDSGGYATIPAVNRGDANADIKGGYDYVLANHNGVGDNRVEEVQPDEHHPMPRLA